MPPCQKPVHQVVSMQYRLVTDRRTGRRTDRRTQYRAIMESRKKPATDHYDAVSTCHDDNIRETRLSMLCNSLRKTVLSSDSVAVFKSRLKTFLFSKAFSSFPAPAPLKLGPYGAIQICLLLLLLLLNVMTIGLAFNTVSRHSNRR